MEQFANNAIEVARQALADELACHPATITVGDITPTEWNDSSLGCPQPGMMYLQVITPGFQIVLEHNGTAYTFHTDRGRRAVHCDKDG